jgi:hypothetical protein
MASKDPSDSTDKKQGSDGDAGGLTNQNVTRPAPIDQTNTSPSHDQAPKPAGLEDQNVTQPSPPD